MGFYLCILNGSVPKGSNIASKGLYPERQQASRYVYGPVLRSIQKPTSVQPVPPRLQSETEMEVLKPPLKPESNRSGDERGGQRGGGLRAGRGPRRPSLHPFQRSDPPSPLPETPRRPKAEAFMNPRPESELQRRLADANFDSITSDGGPGPPKVYANLFISLVSACNFNLNSNSN